MDHVADILVNATLQGEHSVQIGPPGTAKSMMIDKLTQCISGAEVFKYLMTMFTTPSEVMGELDIIALKQGVERYKTDHKLPTAHIAFIDEVFKGNSAILNSLLMLINERRVNLGGSLIDVPLWSLHSASNEIPDDQSLRAYMDRILYWAWVGDIQESDNFDMYIQRSHIQDFKNWTSPTQVDFDELKEACNEALTQVKLSHEIREKFGLLRDLLIEDGVRISNRRWQQALNAVKVYAWLDDENMIFEQHLSILKHCLWQDLKERKIVELHVENVSTQSEQRIIELCNDAQNCVNELLKLSDSDAIIERITELDNIKYELGRIKHPNCVQAIEAVERMKAVDAHQHLSGIRSV